MEHLLIYYKLQMKLSISSSSSLLSTLSFLLPHSMSGIDRINAKIEHINSCPSVSPHIEANYIHLVLFVGQPVLTNWYRHVFLWSTTIC